MIKEIEEIYKLVSEQWISETFSMQTISFLVVTEKGEGQTSVTSFNLLEPSVHLNITHI